MHPYFLGHCTGISADLDPALATCVNSTATPLLVTLPKRRAPQNTGYPQCLFTKSQVGAVLATVRTLYHQYGYGDADFPAACDLGVDGLKQ